MPVPRAVQQLVDEFFRHFLERFFYIHSVILGQRVDHLAVEAAEFH